MSRIAPMIIAATLGGIVVGGIVWFARPAPPAPAAAPVVSAAPVTVSPTPASTGPAPPWAGNTAPSSAGNDLSAVFGATSADPKKNAARQAVRAKIASLTANGRHPTPAEMNVVLGDLERIEGSSIISGVNVGALRSNLVKVDEMQRLAEEMKVESQKPNGGDPEKSKQILARLQKLQGEMRMDIAAPTATTPAPVITQK